MSTQLKWETGKEVFHALRYIVAETLDSLQLKYEQYLQPDAIYGKFVGALSELMEQRAKHVGIGNRSREFQQDAVITFN
jgi:hypothetical protein